MPQANITYNTAYNRDLVSRLNQMEEDMLFQNKHQYHPSPMGYRMSSFHDAQGIANTPNIGRDYSYSSGGAKMTGGGANKKFILNGNSPAYPPANMKAGLAVSSGGSRGSYIGVSGAVSGGSMLGDFKKGFDGVLDSAKKAASTAAAVAPIIAMGAKAMSGSGRTRGRPAKGHVGRTQTKAKGGVKSGGNILKGLASLAKKIAPIALPLLTGLGRKATMADKRKACADAITGGNFWDSFKKGFSDVADLAAKVAPIALPLMTGLGKKQYGGSFNFGKFLEKVAKKAIGMGKGKKMVGSKKDACGRSSGTRDFGMPCGEVGGNILDDAIEATKPLVRKGKAAVKEAIIENAPKATKALKKVADKAITKAVGGGRSARAAIVKKVMAEKGMKMIEASRYVKEHGLYKK